MNPHRFVTIGLLGTDVETWIVDSDLEDAAVLKYRIVRELRTLEAELSIYDPGTPMSRWRLGDDSAVTPSLQEVVEAALDWQDRSGGAFHPFASELGELWKMADKPSAALLASTIDQLSIPRVRSTAAGDLERLGECSNFDGNAVAKGWIVDHALERAIEGQLSSGICVSVGGDLRWTGPGTWRVGIENPLRPFDNEPPISILDLEPGAVATSGIARRRLGDTAHGHLIDPRSGRPASLIASATVIADCASDADAAATAAAVMQPEEAVDWLSNTPSVRSALIVARDGAQHATQDWPVPRA